MDLGAVLVDEGNHEEARKVLRPLAERGKPAEQAQAHFQLARSDQAAGAEGEEKSGPTRHPAQQSGSKTLSHVRNCMTSKPDFRRAELQKNIHPPGEPKQPSGYFAEAVIYPVRNSAARLDA